MAFVFISYTRCCRTCVCTARLTLTSYCLHLVNWLCIQVISCLGQSVFSFGCAHPLQLNIIQVSNIHTVIDTCIHTSKNMQEVSVHYILCRYVCCGLYSGHFRTLKDS